MNTWQLSKGDLVESSKKHYKGQRGIIVKGPYNHRFLNRDDYEMISHGLGHLAGSYGSAVDVMFTASGRTIRHSTGDVKRVATDG